MELLYEPQRLVAGQLNNSFNQINNCEVIKPSWKGNKTYGDNFFVQKRRSISEDTPNIPAGIIYDNLEIDGIEYLLIHNGLTGLVAYFDGLNYTQLGNSFTIGTNTPKRFAKGKTGTGEMTTSVAIGDPYRDVYDMGIWFTAIAYTTGDVVSETGTLYRALQDHTSDLTNQPALGLGTFWEKYEMTADLTTEDPINKLQSDIFGGSYVRLKLIKTGIRDNAIVGSFVFFDNDSSGILNGITSQIYYTETSYIDKAGTEIALDADEVYVYIRDTNKHGITPLPDSTCSIAPEVAVVPVVATDDDIIAITPTKTAGVIDGALTIILYTAISGDYIKDLTNFNGVLFGLTNNEVVFSQTLPYSGINFYPLDKFENIGDYERLIQFGKLLIGFGQDNIVISLATTDKTTKDNEEYGKTLLQYNGDLYSKYSAISSMSSLYVLQDDKQFLKIDIISDNNVDYEVITTNAIEATRGLFENIAGEIYMNEWDKIVHVLDVGAYGTYYYNYDIDYKHWLIGDYLTSFYKVEDKLYGDGMYVYGNEFFDNVDDYRTQIVGFDFGGDDLYKLKQVDMVKIIFGINEKVLDYELIVNYTLGGILHTETIDLKNYPINIEIGSPGSGGLGDSNFGITLLGNGVSTPTKTIGTFVSVTVGLGLTGSVFNFEIKSKENGFIYGGSVIGYKVKIPTVTEFNYKH